ncbi:sterol desaturase family protein [Sphingomonas sp. 28-63-12]|uniref:sterol desaturase family protein n=1 Tax=Sphingomonas sp. 28-63-12 TaxID=1970434 RepID=UPI000BC981EE|nr:MAG: fatty acid hydroxylase [Sphingomonas sp. 28-63-12]
MRLELIAIGGVYAGFALLEAISVGFFSKAGATRQDAIVEIVGTLMLIAVTQPLVIAAGFVLAQSIAPGARDALIGWPILGQLVLLLVCEDMMQYWWHRASHTIPWLYKLHRPHHNAEYMSVRVVYRNNIFYYVLMPSLWISGALVYLGLGWLYAGYAVVKMTVIIGAHSDVRWDRSLYRNRFTAPLMWVVERVISTPATHFAHHGRHADDGITNYKGNFGNLLFVWDIIFGTAKITRRYPALFGVENLPPTSAGEQLLWPLIRMPKAPEASIATAPASSH